MPNIDLPELDLRSADFADALFINMLITCLNDTNDRIVELKEKRMQSSARESDYRYEKKLRKALRRVLCYHLTPTDQKRYGLVK